MSAPLPHMTVVIPTRERVETLPHALQTVVDQDYDNLTIIVSDNCSTDGTADVVATVRDPRIRYLRTPARVGMSRNWEFALSAVEDGFVTFIGDDDGLMPNAVRDAAAVLMAERVPALVWNKVQYTWPTHPEPHHRDKLILPMGNALVRCNARDVVRDCAAFWTAYFVAPCVYNSFVSMEAVARVRQRSGGTFFHSVTPDVYSGFAIASAIDEYVHLSRPFSINGASGRSNGASARAYLRDTSANTEMARFVQEADLPLHPLITEVVPGSGLVLVLEAILQANDHCFGGSLPVDLKRSIRKIVHEIQLQESARYESVVAALQRIFGNGPLRGTLHAALRKYPHRVPKGLPMIPPGLSAEALTVDAAPLGITNVHEAARLAATLVGPFTMPTRRGRYRHHFKYVTRAMRLLRERMAPTVWD